MKIQSMTVVMLVYFLSMLVGAALNPINAEVKAPGEYNQPMSSGSSVIQGHKTQPVKPQTSRAQVVKPQTTKRQPAKVQPVQKLVQAQPNQAYPENTQQMVEQQPVGANGAPEVKDENGAVMTRPVSEAAAMDQGATLYSVTSSMMSDIQRLEEDLAMLKNKVNILMNMR